MRYLCISYLAFSTYTLVLVRVRLFLASTTFHAYNSQVAAEGLSLEKLVQFAEQRAARLEDYTPPQAVNMAPTAAAPAPSAILQRDRAAPPGAQASSGSAAEGGGGGAAAFMPAQETVAEAAPASVVAATASANTSGQETAAAGALAPAGAPAPAATLASGGGVVALHYDEAQRARNLGVGGADKRIEKLRKLNNWVRVIRA